MELFEGTVAENISRFDPEADPAQVLAAAKLADVHSMIVGLREGYDTQIGQDGHTLSAGQRQRIGLARALYGNPFLVVLDEPNSNLDGEGEQALAGAIRSVRERGGVAIVIAHRPSALQDLDFVLVMNQGRAQAFGPKEQVLSSLFPAPQPIAAPKIRVTTRAAAKGEAARAGDAA